MTGRSAREIRADFTSRDNSLRLCGFEAERRITHFASLTRWGLLRQYARRSTNVQLLSDLIPTASVKIRREPDVTELVLMLGFFAFAGIGWTAWDIRNDLRRRKLK